MASSSAAVYPLPLLPLLPLGDDALTETAVDD